MALTVNCATAGSGVMICELQKLELVIDQANVQEAIGTFELLGGPSDITLIGASIVPGRILLEDTAAWLAAWDDIYVKARLERSTLSDVLATMTIVFSIEATFTCTDGSGEEHDQTIKSYNTEIAEDVCYNGPQFKAGGSLANGIVSGNLFSSSPLADCNGFLVQGGLFKPNPVNVQVVDMGLSTNDICLSASGGSPPYMYVIEEGFLPSGRSLDPDGCIRGEPDGRRGGSDELVVRAIDSTGEEGTVTCRYLYCAFELGDLSNITH